LGNKSGQLHHVYPDNYNLKQPKSLSDAAARKERITAAATATAAEKRKEMENISPTRPKGQSMTDQEKEIAREKGRSQTQAEKKIARDKKKVAKAARVAKTLAPKS
jgi:hypothetical protein